MIRKKDHLIFLLFFRFLGFFFGFPQVHFKSSLPCPYIARSPKAAISVIPVAKRFNPEFLISCVASCIIKLSAPTIPLEFNKTDTNF